MHKIGIIMGSDSDLRIMRDAAQTCAQFHVPHEVTIVSAHRTPERLLDYGKTAALLALRILGASDDTLRDRLAAYQSEMRETVLAKAEALKNEYPCDY